MEDNITAVQEQAIMFAYLEPVPTMVPQIVYHPFFYFTTYCVQDPKSGKVKSFDITNAEELKAAREIIVSIIKQCDTVQHIVWLIRKAYRLTFIKYIDKYLSSETFSKILADAYIHSENPNRDKNVSVSVLKKWFHKADKKFLMNEKEYQKYCNLPDQITVYRGIRENGKTNGLSWTTDYEQAVWFSKRFSHCDKADGKVLVATISKEHVFACFDGRGENEIICQPHKFTYV